MLISWTKYGDTVIGTAGNDRLFGLEGDDVFVAGAGDDMVHGGADNDFLWNSQGNDTVLGGTGDDVFQMTVGTRGPDDTEKWLGRDGYDTLTVTSGQDTFVFDARAHEKGYGTTDFGLVFRGFEAVHLDYNGGGDAVVRMGKLAGDTTTFYGDDLIYGSPGDDKIDSGSGRDTVYGRGGNDTIDAYRDTQIDNSLSPDTAPDRRKFFGGKGDDSITTHDSLVGDEIYGQAGNDTLPSGSGPDRLFGGAGRDSFNGDFGDDWIIGGADRDVIVGWDGNDTLVGGVGNDALYGSNGNDRLHGGQGNDYIVGGFGNDTMRGGLGEDVFSFYPGRNVFHQNSFDMIMDFELGIDQVAFQPPLWGGVDLTAEQVVDQYASYTEDGILFAFSDTATVEFVGLTDLALLISDMKIYAY